MSLSRLKDDKSTNPKFNQGALLLVALVLISFALSPRAQAVSPAPDGDYANENTAEGKDALFSVTPGGGSDTAIGFHALYKNTDGFNNTAVGAKALENNTFGSSNTATGHDALVNNQTGSSNTANGDLVLLVNTIGSENTGMGFGALWNNSTGYENTATGVYALVNNTTGYENTAAGVYTLYTNQTGGGNTANGASALYANQTGGSNTATGAKALEHNTTGSGNIALGYGAGKNLTTGSNNIDIGNNGVAAESNTIRIGNVKAHTNTFIAGIYKKTVANGVTVVVDSTGHLGTTSSAERFKAAIKPMDRASEAILALKPVAFRYRRELDPEGIPQFGLIAEEVAAVDPDLVVRDENGEIYTVRYDAVNAMLLNEFLKEHRAFIEERRKVEKLEATVAQQHKDFEATVAELKGQIQKVSARLELSESVPQTVLNNQ